MSLRTPTILVVLIACWPGMTTGRPANPVRDSSRCPQLFGDVQDHAENRIYRKDFLRSVTLRKHCIAIVHSQDWQKPTPADYLGIELTGTQVEEGSGPRAILRLSQELEDIPCPPGRYRVRVDDSLGDQGRILAILPDILLVEYHGKLRYLRKEGIETPVWRTIWVSPWKVPKAPTRSPGTTRTPSHRNRSRPSSSHRRKRH